MPTKQPRTISETLRETIAASGVPLLRLQREAGVERASLSRFLRGKQSLRLDFADKLATYFGLSLQPVKQ